jgi:hypothetical protein
MHFRVRESPGHYDNLDYDNDNDNDNDAKSQSLMDFFNLSVNHSLAKIPLQMNANKETGHASSVIAAATPDRCADDGFRCALPILRGLTGGRRSR